MRALDRVRAGWWRFVIAGLLLLVMLNACAGNSASSAETITIGILAPLSGDYEPLGHRVRDAAVLAVESQNQRGGVLGRQVQVVLKDTACDYFAGREAAQAAIDEGARFLIGAVCTDASEGVAQIAGPAGALQISPASVEAGLTLDAEGEVRPLVFRMPTLDVVQGEVAARFALEQLGLRRAAILYARGSGYGGTLADAFERVYGEGGGEVVARQTYDQDEALFFDALEAVRDEAPEVLYMPGYHPTINVLVAQARQFGLMQPILGSDGWHSPDLDLAVVDGAYFTTHFYTAEPRALVQEWVQLYEARYLTPPDALATMSYDAVNLLFASMEVVGFAEPTLVAQALGEMSFDGVSGSVVFDAAHNPVKSLIVLRADAAGFVFQGRFWGTVEPEGEE
jgi:branched-chain amino acid transport system substrate-binding protein